MKAAGILAAVVCVNVALIGGSVGTAAAVAAPANDKISGATVVSVLPFTQTLDTTGATTDGADRQANAPGKAAVLMGNQLCGDRTFVLATPAVVVKFVNGPAAGGGRAPVTSTSIRTFLRNARSLLRDGRPRRCELGSLSSRSTTFGDHEMRGRFPPAPRLCEEGGVSAI